MTVTDAIALSPEQEDLYQARQRHRSLPLTRQALGFGVALLLLLALWDQWIAGGFQGTVLALRAALAITWAATLASLRGSWGQARMDGIVLSLHGLTATLSSLILANLPHGFEYGLVGLLLPAFLLGVLSPNVQYTFGFSLVYLVIPNAVMFSVGTPNETLINANFMLLPALGGLVAISAQVQRYLRIAFADETSVEEQRRQLATIDPLTQAFNRHHFFRLAAIEIERCRRHSHPLSLLVVRVDDFKQIEAERGQAGSDMVLASLGLTAHHALRQTDVFGRLGEAEFGIMLTDTPKNTAVNVAERLRAAAHSNPIGIDADTSLTVSVTISCVELLAGETELAAVLHRAEKAVYLHGPGRNRVVSR